MAKETKGSYKAEREKLLKALRETDATDANYPELQKRLRALEEADNIRKTRWATADTVLRVTANCALTVGLVLVESKIPIGGQLAKFLGALRH